MGNIWLVSIPTFVACGGFIGTTIHCFTKKPNYHIPKIVFCVACIIALFVYNIPIIKDLVEGETTVVVAEYSDFQSSNTRPGTRKVFFRANNKKYTLYIPTFTRDVAGLETGKIYEIEYFNNSKVIKSYEIIE